MKNSEGPLVSIIIPVFNREELIAETIKSVLDQTYTNWECILVDDGSTDQSQKVIAKYCEKDSRIKYYQRPDFKIKGASTCRNYGFEKSVGELIQYLDSDDVMGPNKLKGQIELYKTSSQLVLFTCKWGWFSNLENTEGRLKSSYKCYKDFNYPWKILETFGYYNEFLPVHNYLIPRSLNLKAGNWNETLSYNDDAEFFTRIIMNSNNILFCDKAIVYYRVLKSQPQLSNFNSIEKANSAIQSWKIIYNYLALISNESAQVYVRNALFKLYPMIKSAYPNLKTQEKEFFSKRRDYNNYYYRLINKLRSHKIN
jgi:glycosyltransferase involved in cell wall biosynthesis